MHCTLHISRVANIVTDIHLYAPWWMRSGLQAISVVALRSSSRDEPARLCPAHRHWTCKPILHELTQAPLRYCFDVKYITSMGLEKVRFGIDVQSLGVPR